MPIRRAAALCVPLAIAAAVLIGTPRAATQTPSQTGDPPAAPTTLPADPSALLSWRSIGPPRGGRSIAVSGVKGRPREAYFGAVGGGLWKTTDAGETWAAVTDGQIGSSSVGAVAVSESNPDLATFNAELKRLQLELLNTTPPGSTPGSLSR